MFFNFLYGNCLNKLTCQIFIHVLVKVLAHVSISGDYPSTRPIVLLKIEDRQPGECLTRNNSNAIRVRVTCPYIETFAMLVNIWLVVFVVQTILTSFESVLQLMIVI